MDEPAKAHQPGLPVELQREVVAALRTALLNLFDFTQEVRLDDTVTSLYHLPEGFDVWWDCRQELWASDGNSLAVFQTSENGWGVYGGPEQAMWWDKFSSFPDAALFAGLRLHGFSPSSSTGKAFATYEKAAQLLKQHEENKHG